MNKANLVKILSVTFLLASLSGISAAAQQDVELTLHLRKKEFHVAEPVVVELKMTYRGKKAVELQEPDFATQTLRLWFQDEKGESEQYRLPYVSDNLPLLSLAPGETFRTQALLFYNYEKNTLFFPQPGDYTLKVEHLGYISLKHPEPAEIKIRIIPNDAANDKKWEEFFSQKETIDFLDQFSWDMQIGRRLEDLIRKYPQSLFAPYGCYYLAHQEAAEFSGKPPHREKAIELMKKADVKGFQLEPEVLFYLAQWSQDLGYSQEALNYLDRLAKEFPATKLAETAGHLKEQWSAQKPLKPGKKVEPPTLFMKLFLQQALDKYFTAFQQKNVEGCLAVLDEQFLYNGVLNKAAMAKELKEDFNKDVSRQGPWRVLWEAKSWQVTDGIPYADINISYYTYGTFIFISRPYRIYPEK